MESMRRSMSHMLNRELSRGFGAWRRWRGARAFMQKLRKGLSVHGEPQAGGGLRRACDGLVGSRGGRSDGRRRCATS